MEIGIAIAYGRRVLILAEDCVEQEEYSRKLQSESQYEVFNREEFNKHLEIIISRIKKEYDKNHH